MSRATVSAPGLLTAEEYGRRPDSEYPDELVEGKVVTMTVPNRRHRQICNVVLDEASQTALLQRSDAMPRRLSSDEELTLPSILPGFAGIVAKFFE